MDKQRIITNAVAGTGLADEETDNNAVVPGPRVIASPLLDNKLAGAFADVVSGRWDNWDLSPWMAYLVDVCDESVLPYLADQFNVEGLRGFEVAGDQQQQRELIKKSITLHRYLGTPWAVKEACKTIGFPIVSIEEGVSLTRRVVGEDGIEYKEEIESEDDWARFKVLIEINEDRTVSEEEIRKLHQFIDFYKNLRSELADLGFSHKLSDNFIFSSSGENLELIRFTATPTSILINPDGEGRKVTIHTSVPWKVNPSLLWNDGTTDKLYVEMTGENEITIHSDYNRKADREAEIEITTLDGVLLGTIQVIQHLNWHNAYGNAYSNAYNWNVVRSNAYSQDYSRAYNTETYISLAPGQVILYDTGEAVELLIKSNTDWNIV